MAFFLSFAIGIIVFVTGLVWRQRKKLVPDMALAQKSFGLEKLTPYPDTHISGAKKPRITMGLKRLDAVDWLTVDKNYRQRHAVRTKLFDTQNSKVSQFLPEAKGACEEALTKVSSFLCNRYPTMFETRDSASGTLFKNKETGEEFFLNESNNAVSELEIAARLAMEDMTILLKNDNDEHYVAATSSTFLIGWSADSRMGSTIAQMHSPVPQWKEQVGHPVNKFMGRLTTDSPMERSSYFIQVIEPDEPWSSILFQPDGLLQDHVVPTPERIIVRRERQTFVRLPRSGGILFTVKTSLTFLPELPLEELQGIVKETESYPDDMAKYKGRAYWGEAILKYCKEREQLEGGREVDLKRKMSR